MYHMTRGYDESSRLVSEQPVPSSSAPNLTIETPTVETRPTVYGSIENQAVSMNSETDPLINSERSSDPNV